MSRRDCVQLARRLQTELRAGTVYTLDFRVVEVAQYANVCERLGAHSATNVV
jgi:hypothetical protein